MNILSKITLGMVLIFAIGTSAKSTKPSGNSKPKFSAPSKPKPPAHSGDKGSPKPKFSAPSKPKPPAHSGDKGSPKPKFSAPSGETTSVKPKNTGSSEMAQAAKRHRSETKFAETSKSVLPPKPKYTTPEGKNVVVRTGSKDVEYIRNLPSSSIKPEVRNQNISVHINQHYHHPYSYYHSQPVVYVGGGYSSVFWWMMMEWDAERRAKWLYHNRYNIETDAYNIGVRDAQVAEYVKKMESQRVSRNGAYVDSEFKDPSLMYTDDYVIAAYNPETLPHAKITGKDVLVFMGWVVASLTGVVLIIGIIYIVFYHRW